MLLYILLPKAWTVCNSPSDNSACIANLTHRINESNSVVQKSLLMILYIKLHHLCMSFWFCYIYYITAVIHYVAVFISNITNNPPSGILWCQYLTLKLFFNRAIVNVDDLPSWFLWFHYVHPSYTNKVLLHPHWNLQVDKHDGRTEGRGPGRESPPVTVHQTCNDKDAQCMPQIECCVGWRSTGNQL